MKTKNLLLKTSISFMALVSSACAMNPTAKSNDFSSDDGVVLSKTTFTVSADACSKYYGKGYCTDYAKSKTKAPFTGNAIVWYDKAKNKGSKAFKGALAIYYSGSTGHVSVVEEVYKDGTYRVSHMNFGSRMVDSKCAVTDKFGVVTYTTMNPKSGFGKNIKGFIYAPFLNK